MANIATNRLWSRLFIGALAAFGLTAAAWSADPMVNVLSDDESVFRDVFESLPDARIDQLCSALQDPRGSAATVCKAQPGQSRKRTLLGTLVQRSEDTPRQALKARADREDFVSQLEQTQQLSRLSAEYVAVVAERTRMCKERPQIHNIGHQAVLTFEDKTNARAATMGERAVRIPIDGFGLDPRCVSFAVQVDGTVPVSRFGQFERGDRQPDFWVTQPTSANRDVANILLLQPYIDRLQTGDKVTVSVTASSRFPDSDGVRKVAYGKRSFTLYEIKDYRNLFLRSRIGPHDFSAFPIPDDEAGNLFGPLVVNNYFVVRLSIRNTTSDAKLVSTGMICAFGTARIDPKSADEPSFSVPVSVVPHSIQQIYTVLQDEEVNQTRSWVFRALEFAGALASGINAVTSAGVQSVKNVGLFSGIVVPEGRKVWPDRWPGYQRNIVNYAMPDLVKIPANSVVDHKFLFFSKRELDGLVSDPYLFGPLDASRPRAQDRRAAKPDAYVIALGFDSLDIRFESVFDVAAVTPRDDLAALVTDVPKLIESYRNVQPWTTNKKPSDLFGVLSAKKLDDMAADLDAVSDIDLAAAFPELDDKAVDPLLAHVKGLKYADAGGALAVDLFGAGGGLPALVHLQQQVHAMNQKIIAGTDAALLKDRIDAATAEYKLRKQVLEYYQLAARTVAQLAPKAAALKTAAETLDSTPGDAASTAAVKKAADEIVAALEKLSAQKPASAVTLAGD